MSEPTLHDWIEVNEQMQVDYRLLVAMMAVRQIERATPELRRLALESFTETISIPGFRSFERADLQTQRRHLAQAMQKFPQVTALAICLWAEAAADTIARLRQAGEKTGLQFEPTWGWSDGIDGYYAFEDVSSLRSIATTLGEAESRAKKDHFQLAVLWLSRGIIADVPAVVEASPQAKPQAGEDAGKIQAEPLEKQDGTAASSTPPTIRLVGGPDESATVPPHHIEPEAAGEDEEQLQDPSTLLSRLEQESQRADEYERQIGQATAVFSESVASINVPDTEVAFGTLSTRLDVWRQQVLKLDALLVHMHDVAHKALVRRPDLDINAAQRALIEAPTPGKGGTRQSLQQMHDLLAQLAAYDRQRAELLKSREAALSRVAMARLSVALWSEQDSLALSTDANDSEVFITLAALRSGVARLDEEEQRLERVRSQHRDVCLVRIQSIVERLKELELPPDTPVEDDFLFNALTPAALAQIPDRRLAALEKTLNALVEAQTLQVKRLNSVELTHTLQQEWSTKNLISLLDRLACEQRNLETLLLDLAASGERGDSTPLELPTRVIEALLRAALQIAPERPLQLLNQLSSFLINGRARADMLGRTELCLAMLGAHIAGDSPLSPDVFWNLATEWPLEDMPGWNMLWQAALLNAEPPRIRLTPAPDRSGLLAQVRGKATQALAREGGGFTSLHGLQSKRHVNLLAKIMYPKLELMLEELEVADQELQRAPENQQPRLVEKLKKMLGNPEFAGLEESALEASYEAGIVHEGIDDNNTFHRQKAVKRWVETGESVKAYGDALSAFWQFKLQGKNELDRNQLLTELKRHSELAWIGQLTLDQLAAWGASQQGERDEAQAWQAAAQQLTRYVLTQSACSLQLPHTVGWLVGSTLDLARLRAVLLEDLGASPDPTMAAKLLIAEGASTQALLLNPYVGLDLQNAAQKRLAEQKRQTKEFQEELVKWGGDASDLDAEESLGRWPLIERELGSRLAERRMAHAKQRQIDQDHQHELKRRWDELEEGLFAIRDTMPGDAFELAEEGLMRARKAINYLQALWAVGEYLDEMEYRIGHKAWFPGEVRKAVEALERATSGSSASSQGALTVEGVLRAMDTDDLAALRFGPFDISMSKVEGRGELLRNWLRVRDLSGFQSDEQKVPDRQAIQWLFRYFSQMVKLKHIYTPGGAELDLEEPVVHSYRSLEYPKTDVLKDDCILMVLPGNPPRKIHVQQFEYWANEKSWLEYEFLILFVPGCNEAIYNRLHTTFAQQRLVLIDEKAILAMVLAESNGRRPLDLLRSQMLDALGARNVEVFHVNQLVNPETAIFVGREREVAQISNSDGSYAIYGGRRIGKSSLMMAIRDRLEKRGVQTAIFSFEGQRDCSDDASARELANALRLKTFVNGIEDFKHAIQDHLDTTQDQKLVLLIDEVDKYVEQNAKRHLLFEALRSLADRNTGRFRVIVVGFMRLYDCLVGRGPYSASSNPWPRMFNHEGPLGNLLPDRAAEIVGEGFIEILGWEFEHRGIPQKVVAQTGGHPAFVQEFCRHLQQRVGERGDRCVQDQDIKAIFEDSDPHRSFMAYVGSTLEMNLDPIGRYLILWLANEAKERSGFTKDQVWKVIHSLDVDVPEAMVAASLEQLQVTSVVRERSSGYFEFSVPDYPLILDRLGYTQDMDVLEGRIERLIHEQDNRR